MLLVCAAASACTAPNPDYMLPITGCTAGARSCEMGRPYECDVATDGGTFNAPSACPKAGGCATGHCIPPMPAERCTREADCAAEGKTCTAFVDQTGANLSLFCSPPDGAAMGAAPCTTGGECRSNLCVSVGGQGTKQVCYVACSVDGDCGNGQRCRKYTVTVTGVQGTIQGCSPP